MAKRDVSEFVTNQDALRERLISCEMGHFDVRLGLLLGAHTRANREVHADFLLEFVEAIEARAIEHVGDLLSESQEYQAHSRVA